MDQLGYQRYAVYSTDLGFTVALNVLSAFQERIVHHVTDFYFVIPNDTDQARYTANETTPEETRYMKSYESFITNHSAYAEVMSTLPLSIAYPLNDSPMGFLAWIYQLVHTVSDKPWTVPKLIHQTLLLYMPGVMGNIRSYKALFNGLNKLSSGGLNATGVPTSVLQFGGIDAYPALANFNFAVSIVN